MTMEQADLLERRLRDAVGVADVLAAGWEIFEFAAAAAAAAAGQAADLYPAFTFARGSAISGRNAIALAPSLPAPPEGLAPAEGEAGEIADAIAGLASALSERLQEAAGLAADPDDRTACADAARDAARISELLAGDM